jgi:ribosomal protein S27AE
MTDHHATGDEQTCRICGQSGTLLFEAPVLGRHAARYVHCGKCGFVQVGNLGWLDEAYRETITREDTMILDRNIRVRRNLLVILFYLFLCSKTDRFLDYAGGTGLLVRLMRDAGYDFHWQDPYTPNLFARGFEMQPGTTFKAVTCIEGLEHFTSPLDELTRMFALSDTLICTTCLLPRQLTPDWPYLGRRHGQHISFFAAETLAYLASHFGARYYYLRGLHILTRQPVNPRRLAALRLACRSRVVFVALYLHACRCLGSLAYTDADWLADHETGVTAVTRTEVAG